MKLVFALVGLTGMAAAIVLGVRRLRVVLFGLSAEGQVVSHQARELDDAVHYLPVISFIDRDGRQRGFTSVAGSAMRRPRVGDTVPVRYDGSDPRRAYISTFLHMWAAPLAFAVLGVAGWMAFFQV